MTSKSAWSFVGPFLIAVLIGVPTHLHGAAWVDWARGIGAVTTLIFAGWGMYELAIQLLELWMWAWQQVQNARYHMSAGGQAKDVAGLRPDQVQYLYRMMGAAWILKVQPGVSTGPEFLLGGAESVTVEFVKFVIDHSDDHGLYPQNRFDDKMYTFDPVFRVTTDRAMYRALQSWLSMYGIIEWPAGNQPARWRGDWSPKAISDLLYLDAFSAEASHPSAPAIPAHT